MIIGLDAGGTKVNGLLVDSESMAIIDRRRASSAGSADQLADTVAGLIADLQASADRPVSAIGLGVAGLVESSGRVRYSPNLPALVEYPLAAQVEQRCGTPVRVLNDATAGAWAEARLGAGRGVDHFVYVALGTGIGTGLVVDGRIVVGANGFAGEAGHMVIDRHGRRHHTGQRGPWELDASGDALGRVARAAADAGRFDAGLAEAGSIEAITGQDVARAVATGDPQAIAILDEFAHHVALGAANLVLVLDPSHLVIGGGLADIGEPLRAAIAAALPEHLLGAPHRPPVEVVIAQLGPDAAAMGAALAARDQELPGTSAARDTAVP